ncbi:phosphotransferase family protein [Kitasatospora sp. NPDC088783]|uniref:phosphotransferase family protein n=1 Tax=Kitasatospora sp. NPDC088783 TaxID=3364077 RepID=UPI0038141CCA
MTALPSLDGLTATSRAPHPDPAGTARQALADAALDQGLDPTGAELLHDARNWTFRLPNSGAVGKVHNRATSHTEVLRQARTADALLAANFPTAAPLGRISEARGHLVSFTEDLGSKRPSEAQHGALIRRLHLLRPTGFDATPVDWVARAFTRLSRLRPTAISDTGRAGLHRFLTAAADAYRQARWPELCLTHNDITLTNSVLTDNRGPALLDLETLGLGNPGFDQAASAFARDAFGKDPVLHKEWVDGYGYDIAEADPGRYELLVPVVGASSCLFYLDWADRTRPEARPEAELRLETLLEGRSFPWGWVPLNMAKKPEPADTTRHAS